MKVQIWSDVVCPWCYVGKRRFEKALSEFDEEVEVEWRSFELDPSAALKAEKPLDEALAHKYRASVPQAREMIARMAREAAGDGLEFNFDIAKTGNTLNAHRLLHAAKERGLGDAMKERLFAAYLTDGLPIYDVETLVKLGTEVGLTEEEARAAFEGNAYVDAVREDEHEAQLIGVTGVPFFLIDGKYGIPGAQTPDVLLQVLERARREAIVVAAPPGAVCDENGCEIPDAKETGS